MDHGQRREGFLDAVRAIALVRVVIWHAFGAAVITYIVAAVPAIVFVSGSLLARSLARRRAREVIADRLRRLLVPYWVFAAAALAAMAVARRVLGPASGGLSLADLLTWLVPVVDPVGTAWQAGWLTSPLWYVRLFVWLLVLAVPLRRAVLARPAMVIGGLTLATFATDLVSRHPLVDDLVWHRTLWYLGDLTLYGAFFAFGMLHGDGRLSAIRRRTWVVVTVVAGLAAAAWVAFQPVPAGVVNHSHPAHLLVGLTWLAVALAAQPWVTRLAQGRRTALVVTALTRRSLTVYLWHSTAIISTYRLLWAVEARLPAPVEMIVVLAGTVAGTLALTLLTGWVEDRAARRPPALWPLPRQAAPLVVARPRPLTGAVAGLGAGLLALSLMAPLVGPSAAATPPPAPSRQPDRLVWLPAVAAQSSTDSGRAMPQWAQEVVLPGVLASIATNAARAHGMPGLAVGVLRSDGFRWTWATGTGFDGLPLSPNRELGIASLTKSFTAALIWQEIEAGRLTLDDPLPPMEDLAGVERFTVRQLLGHRTGLAGYRGVVKVFDGLDPRSLVARVLAEPLAFEPGTVQSYSSSNYLVLGLLLERVTGSSYDELLRTRLLGPLGLDHTRLSPALGHGWATGGMHSTIEDLLDWGAALLRDDRVVKPASLAAMTQVGENEALGDGLAVFCPCTVHPDGRREPFAVGMYGATTRLAYVPSLDVVVVVELGVSQWDIPERPGQVDQLVADLATAARQAG